MRRRDEPARAVLVTGASKGIGEACALRLDEAGWHVFAGVRRAEDADSLRQRASDRLLPLFLDVTKADQVAAAASAIRERTAGRGLDGLVNNAGIAVGGPLEFLPLDELARQLEVNVLGQVAVFQALRDELRRARGRLVFIGSVAGRSALPLVGAYAASKFALEAVADSLRVELRPAGIDVVLIEPGRVATPIWRTSLDRADRNLESMPPELESRYGVAMSRVRRFIERDAGGLSADAVADVVLRALRAARPRPRYVVGASSKLRVAFEKLAPTRLRDAIIARAIGHR